MKKTIAFALALLFVCNTASARVLGGGADRFAPLRLKIYGYLGEAPAGVPPLTTWTLMALGKKYHFICDKIEVLQGNTSYMNIVSALEPYDPAFKLNGSAQKTFVATPPKQRILMMGVMRFSGTSRIFMLNQVENVETPMPAL